MAIYKSPKERLHRDFFYLNDEVAINSLSALESGKVDEIVSRTTTAREGGFSGEIKIPVVDAGVGGSKKSSSEIEEEMVRTRTRFSIFDAWYRLMHEKKAIGTFDGWGEGALEGVEPGDTVEFRSELSLGPLQTRYWDCSCGSLTKRRAMATSSRKGARNGRQPSRPQRTFGRCWATRRMMSMKSRCWLLL